MMSTIKEVKEIEKVDDADKVHADLHFHSYISDGVLAPSEVIARAHENGANLVALTDHDHTGGVAEAQAKAQELGITCVTGAELSVTWRHQCVHIVGLNFDLHDETMQKNLLAVRQGRQERLARMSEKLEKKGITGVYEGALALAPNPEMVGRAHIARYLLQTGHVKNMQQAFKKYLGEGKPGYVSHEWAELSDAVGWITGAGGIAVIAHPGRYSISATAMRELISQFKEAGGGALEVASSSHSLNERINFAMLADKYELFSSVGSDFHVPGEGGRSIGNPPELPAICQPVWTQFGLN